MEAVSTKFNGDPYVESAGCPHCHGMTGRTPDACCFCHGTGALRTWAKLSAAVAWLWARAGCPCRACVALGPGR